MNFLQRIFGVQPPRRRLYTEEYVAENLEQFVQTAKVKYYVAGPMTGLPEYNYPAFRVAERYLQKCGFPCITPIVSQDLGNVLDYEVYIRLGLQKLVYCSHMLLLPDWEKSVGATLEVMNAMKMGVKIYLQVTIDGRYTMRMISYLEIMGRIDFELLIQNLEREASRVAQASDKP